MANAKIEQVTPAKAEAYLEKNSRNRKLSKATVERLATAMKNGRFIFDGAPIRFATDGSLLDGQHRLSAIIKSGKTQRLLVLHGLKADAQFVMDTGKTRSLSDALQLNEVPNAGPLSSLIKTSSKWLNGVRGHALIGSSQGTPTIPEMLEFYNTYSDELQAAVRTARPVVGATGSSMRVASLAAFVFTQIDATDAEYFFSRLADGAGLPAGSPILVLRNRIIANRDDVRNGHGLHAAAELVFFIKAWNAFREGTTIQRLYFKAGGATPDNFPEPR